MKGRLWVRVRKSISNTENHVIWICRIPEFNNAKNKTKFDLRNLEVWQEWISIFAWTEWVLGIRRLNWRKKNFDQNENERNHSSESSVNCAWTRKILNVKHERKAFRCFTDHRGHESRTKKLFSWVDPNGFYCAHDTTTEAKSD